jgi:hypothetical protein
VLFLKFQIKNKVQKPKNLRIINLETYGIRRSTCMVYVYMHLYVYIRILCRYVPLFLRMCVCMYMNIYIFMHMCICVLTYINIYIHVCIYVWTNVCMYISLYIYIYIRIYVCM